MSPMPPPGICRRGAVLLRRFDHRRFGGDHQAGDRGRVLQRGANHLGRVDDAGRDQVAVLFGLGVEAEGRRLVLQHLADHDRAFDAGVFGDLADRGLQGAADDGDAGVLVVVVALEAFQRLGGLQQRDAAAGHDAFFDRRAGGVEGVVDAVLLFLHFDFGRAADADHRNPAGQLGQTFLQLFLVVVARWCLRSGA